MSFKSKFSKLSIALLSGAAIGAAMITTGGSANADEIYTVKSGDTLSEISYAFNLNGDYNSIAKANNIKNVDVINVGQKLVITNGGDIKKATKSEVKSLPEVAKNTNAANAATTSTTNNTTTTNNAASTQTTAKSSYVAPAQSSTTTSSSNGGSVAQQMAAKTGVSAATWQRIINRESGGNANAVNASSGAYGYFQLLGHGEHAGMSASEQVNMAASVYKAQGMSAWGE
ncbi:LysM peptidoglycan-binding domain-containing protein [Pediococcus pentosaceus]|uniref:LysM peptidoglycan-binding domain-containing protein n=1 Tax=Pediococcus pentosaceus TaxID=1255 RepID=UPI0018A16273|nr:LysM peptidoglycan-binding domain-containing protein [Pediococcus pentosaceus]MBF7124230.1 LysM peptidoglycan-binding domain-containing protein [Pediococcus pentosaceus]MCR1861749.1 LysM peptidoglycan-binding domain-containing protein [Pediococcus pentosaceus]